MKRLTVVLCGVMLLAVPMMAQKDQMASAANPQPEHAMFHVEVQGQGTPMILIPGLASPGAVWNSTVAHYSKQYQCHVLTLAGFASEAPVQGFSLQKVLDELSQYIMANNLDHPVVVGHSLGGTLALWLAAKHLEQVGKLIIVDSLPALGATANPAITSEQLKSNAEYMRQGMMLMTNEARLGMAKQNISAMVTSPSDVELVYGWSKTSDWHSEANAMADLMGLDLRDEVAKIKAPTLVLGTWIAYAQYGGQEGVRHTFTTQYAKLNGVTIEMAPKARHFIMYDDPQWMFGEMDRFLGVSTKP